MKRLYAAKEYGMGVRSDLLKYSCDDVTIVDCSDGAYRELFEEIGYNVINISEILTSNKTMLHFNVSTGNPPYSDRSNVSGANDGGCSNNLDSEFFLKCIEISDLISLIIRAKHFLKKSSKFKKVLFSSGHLKSIKYLPPETFSSIQNTQTCVVTYDCNYNGPCSITYKDGTVVERNLFEDDVIKLDKPDFVSEVENNLSERYINGSVYRNSLVDVDGGDSIVEILGSGCTPVIRTIEPGLENAGRNKHGVIMNMAAEWGGLGKVMIKPYHAALTFSVVCLVTNTESEAVQLKQYLESEQVKQIINSNMASFHPTKDLFMKIKDPLV